MKKRMRKLSIVLLAICMFVCTIFASGCYIIQAQPMKNVKGTYKLTSYIRTDTVYAKDEEGREYKKTTTTDLIETRGYEFYLVVTGNGEGYYVYKDKDTNAYAKEVMLSYQKNSEDGKKYDYVGYRDIDDTEEERLGITKDRLNYGTAAVCFKFFGAPVEQPGYSETWSKVSKATDLSYITEQLGEIPVYGYEEWKLQGAYRLNVNYDATDLAEGETFEYPYAYSFMIFDTVSKKASFHYCLTGTNVDKVDVVNITLLDGWNTIKLGNREWTLDTMSGYYKTTVPATETQIEYTMELSKWYTDETLKAEMEVNAEIARYWEYNPYIPPVCDKFIDVDEDAKCDTCTHLFGEHPICDLFIDTDGNDICDYCAWAKSLHTFDVCDNYVEGSGDGVCDNCLHAKREHTFEVCNAYADANSDYFCDECFHHGVAHAHTYVNEDSDSTCDICGRSESLHKTEEEPEEDFDGFGGLF